MSEQEKENTPKVEEDPQKEEPANSSKVEEEPKKEELQKEEPDNNLKIEEEPKKEEPIPEPQPEIKISPTLLMAAEMASIPTFLHKYKGVSKRLTSSEPFMIISEIFGVKYTRLPVAKQAFTISFLISAGTSFIRTAS